MKVTHALGKDTRGRPLVTQFSELARFIQEHGSSLLSDSHFHSQPNPQAFILWERARRPLCDLIAGPGPFLDVGCANGFLIRCIMEWCPYQIEPFGIDIDPVLVERARVLVPELGTFKVQDLGAADPVRWFGRTFRTIYWNVGENLSFTRTRELEVIPRLKSALSSSGGNLILGFYDRDLGRSDRKVARLRDHGHEVRKAARGLFSLFVDIV